MVLGRTKTRPLPGSKEGGSVYTRQEPEAKTETPANRVSGAGRTWPAPRALNGAMQHVPVLPEPTPDDAVANRPRDSRAG